MTDSEPGPTRLDSWKAIAAYLNRDVATVRRWEKSLGLPIRRVGGNGRSVFAYPSDIDAWLASGAAKTAAAEALPTVPQQPSKVRPAISWRWTLPVLLVSATLGLLAHAWLSAPSIGDLRFEATETGVIARDSDGVEQWRHPWGAGYDHIQLTRSEWAQVSGGARPTILVATTYRQNLSTNLPESGVLTALSAGGRVQHTFAFDDKITFGGREYAAPWAVTAFAAHDTAAGSRVAVAAHHYLWEPSLVTILDDRWQRTGTFAHAGWIEDLHWLGTDRLVVSGFSNERDGGMVALLDANALDGQGPATPGTRYHCDGCGAARPLRMFVLPRSELNRITSSRFNRAMLRLTADHLVASTTEMPPTEDGGIDAVYEFSHGLDFVAASFSDRYWDMHRALEEQGKIDHPRARCPDAAGPREIQMWSPDRGWRTIPARR